MIGHTLAEKKHIINAKEVMQEISSGYQELIDDESIYVISAMNRQLDWIADSMQWLSEKIVDRALEIRQQEEKQLKTLIEKELVTHETEKAYFVSIPKAVMKSNMDGLWIPKRIMNGMMKQIPMKCSIIQILNLQNMSIQKHIKS